MGHRQDLALEKRSFAYDGDGLLWLAVKVYYKVGSPALHRSEIFLPAALMTPGEEALAGSLVVEEKRRGNEPDDLVRV